MKALNPLLIALVVITSSLFAQDNGKISGYMFGDYYYVTSNHDKDIENANGFWMRRIYVTYDRSMNEQFSMRFRLEMNSQGDFSSKDKLTPVVKDAYLKWKKGRHSIILGISGTPTWGVIEKLWGYRPVEKTALDLAKFGSSRDFGVALKGPLDADKKVNYHLMFSNGSSNGSENNDGKKVALALLAKVGNGFLVQGYADFEERPGDTNRYTLQGFVGYKGTTSRFGVQFAHQNRQVAGGDDLTLQIGSLFGAAKLSDKVWGFARIDRAFDPNPDGATISYIPFDKTAKSTFLVAGIEYSPAEDVHLMPNVEAIVYGDNAAGGSPDSDLIPRFTFYYTF